ncbi:bloom syndrome protein [Exophiala viscosa]|uniref:bloom syndrome protein n=1 Tax=Exophiala viscosa TaxID=2486360 RepID=UPI0021912C14|nr:bloom syndrome protein [Exophiala viscosa]
MTKNNLSQCLAWLLQHPHSFGSLEHVCVINATVSGQDDVPESTNEDMARLQLAPQIAPRPRLHVQPTHTNALPTPDPSRASVDYIPTPRRTKQKPETSSLPRRSPRPSTPMTTFDDIKFEDSTGVVDIDEIDLTGEDVTTSSFSEFGPPTKLWRESSASRIEPLPKKRGKKRKSDEYQSDLLSPASARSTTKRVERITTRLPCGGSRHKIAEESDVEEDKHLTQKTTRPTQKNVFKEEEFPDVGVDDDTNLLDALESALETATAQPPSQQARSQKSRSLVPDSDDDEEVGATGPDVLRGSPPGSQPNASQSGRAQVGLEEPLKSSGASHDRNGVPSHDQTRILRSFIETGADLCAGLLERLQRSKKAVKIALLDDMCSENPAASTNMATLKDIESKIAATTQLLQEHEALTKLHDQQTKMLERRDELAEEGHDIDPTDPTNALTRICSDIRRIKVDIDGRQMSVLKLLERAGVTMTSGPPGTPRTAQSRPQPPSTSISTKNVLVASTQKGSYQASPVRNLNHTRDLGLPATQSVRQTPISQRVKADHREPHSTHQERFRPESSTYGATRTAARPAPLLSPPAAHMADEFPSYEEDEDDVRGFSRTMGSPARDFSFNDDEFEDDLDDEEMYKAVEEFEQTLPLNEPASPNLRERPALGELSENIRRQSPSKPAPKSDTTTHASLMQYPWSKDVASALKKRFHLHGFRHNQLEAINATLSGRDAFVLMPTGGGKSLCYQLPSVVQSGRTRGVTIVVSPLLSLMQDQVDHLKKLKIQASLINGDISQEQRSYILSALKGPHPEAFVQLLYVTPEMLNKSQVMVRTFQDLHRRGRLARLVIDEAHCVSQWGHDFRPDYKALGEIRKQFSDVPLMALTATATENVKFDVMHNLGMDNAQVFTQSFNRPNLTYDVRLKAKGQNLMDSIAETIESRYKGQAGIVYCLSRNNCEKVAQQLREDYNINSQHYHAGMPSEERIYIQKQWQAGVFHVIVATIAFGMGIDKPDVRFVIHHSIPKSLEGYYQETGRAGRDGKRSGCYLYYGYADTLSLKRMIEAGDGSWEQKERQKQLLRNVVQFCENRSDCRRAQVLEYFNEHFDPEDCKNGCDNCNSTSSFEEQDFSQHARNAIRLVRKVHRDQVTLLHCIDVYRGAKSKKIGDLGHDDLDEHGMGSDLGRSDVERLFYRLVSEDALAQYNVTNKSGFATQYANLGPNAQVFEDGRRPLKLQVLSSPRNKTKGKAVKPQVRKKVKANTGVAAATDYYPASTNVSSPMQPLSRRRLMQQSPTSSDDDFVVQSSEEEDVVSGTRRKNKDKFGPPIITDENLGTLNETHQHILSDFVERARKEIDAIMIRKSLRQRPITDRVLREIAIKFPTSDKELKQLMRLNPDMYKIFGPTMLRLITTAHNDYEAIMRAQEDRPDDPNHATVVEISDDEFGGVDDVAESDFDPEETESSHYFGVADEVSRFNERMSQIQTSMPKPPKAPSEKPESQRRSLPWKSRGSRGSKRGGGGGGSRPRTKGTAGVTKKKRAGSSARSSTSNPFAARNSRGGRGGGGGGGIGMMPT